MSSCRHTVDEPHTEHFCSDHSNSKKLKKQSEQQELPPLSEPVPETKLQSLQRQFMEFIQKDKVNENPPTSTNVKTIVDPVEEASDEDLPPMEDSSSESGNDHPAMDEDEDQSDSESEAENPLDPLDFDYDSLIVRASGPLQNPVSYTHLTLPTKRIV